LALCATTVFCTLVIRHRDVLLSPQLTWEDGHIFLTEALAHPWYSTWFSPFIGYFIVLPKMVASLFTPLTMWYAPFVFNAFSLGVMTFVLTLPLARAFSGLAPWRPRAVWVAACALMPWHTETFGNLTNVHWYVYFALTLFSVADLTRLPHWARFLLPPALLLSVFTTPNAVAVAPVVAVRLYQERRTPSFQFYLHLFALVCIAAMVTVTLMVDPRPVPQDPVDPLGIAILLIKGVGYKVVVVNLAGGLASVLLRHAVFYIAGAAVFAGLGVWLIRGARQAGRADVANAALVGIYYVMVSILMFAILRPQYVVHFVQIGNYWGADRYFLVPSYYFLLLITLAASRLNPAAWPARLKLSAAAVATAVILMNFLYRAIPDYGWQRQVHAYYERLLNYPPNAPSSTFTIVTFPGGEWGVRAPLFSPSESERSQLRRLTAMLSRSQ